MHRNSTARGMPRDTRSRGTYAAAARAALALATAASFAACSDDVPTQPKANLPADGVTSPSAVIHIIPEGTTFPAKIAFATGARVGKHAVVQLYDKAGVQLASFYAFSAADDFSAGVDVAVGDVNGDGFPDIIAGEGPTTEAQLPYGQSKVSVWDGKTGTLIQTWAPFANFRGGVRVGAGDLDLDGKAEILACTGEGVWGNKSLALKLGSNTPVSGSQVNVYTNGVARSHGCRVAAGDITGDGYPEIVSHFDGKNSVLVARDVRTGTDVTVANPLGSQFDGEADIALSDVNGDKVADVMLSFRLDSAVVRVFDGTTVKPNAPLKLLNEFKPVYEWQSTGIDIALRDMNGDGVADLLFKPMKPLFYWKYSILGINAGSTFTQSLLFMVEPGQLSPGGSIG